MELEDIKFLSKSKRITMAQCALMMVMADGKAEESEWDALGFITYEYLNITAEDLKDNIPSKEKLVASLNTLTFEELNKLGVFLAYVAQSDGHVAKAEIDILMGILRAGGMSESSVQGIVGLIK